MPDPEPRASELTCPNPKCKGGEAPTTNFNSRVDDRWWVFCPACWMSGPEATTEAEAIRLWELLGHRDLARMLAEALLEYKPDCLSDFESCQICGDFKENACRDGRRNAALADARKAHLLPEEENINGH